MRSSLGRNRTTQIYVNLSFNDPNFSVLFRNIFHPVPLTFSIGAPAGLTSTIGILLSIDRKSPSGQPTNILPHFSKKKQSRGIQLRTPLPRCNIKLSNEVVKRTG